MIHNVTFFAWEGKTIIQNVCSYVYLSKRCKRTFDLNNFVIFVSCLKKYLFLNNRINDILKLHFDS